MIESAAWGGNFHYWYKITTFVIINLGGGDFAANLRFKIMLMMNNRSNNPFIDEAVLSSADGFTAFSFRGYNIRFRAPYSLERYVDGLKWDDGYWVVLAKYSHNANLEEEFIDLKPILDGLYIDSASFLKPIKSVRVAYA